MANQSTRINGEKVNITISIGIAEYGKRSVSSQDVIHAADLALYQAKANGRNCISVYQTKQHLN